MPKRPLTAVIINDQQMFSDLLKMIFKEHGITVVASFTLIENGVAYIRAKPPSLTMIEMIMPIVRNYATERENRRAPYVRLESQGSFETVRFLREKFPETKVLLLTGERHPHFYYMGLKAGAHGIAGKADTLKDFERILRRIMNGETRVLSDRMKMTLDEYLVDLPSELTAFEIRILELVQEGLSNTEIARYLHRSPHTIKNALNDINHKLGTGGRINAYERAEEIGLIGWQW